MASSETWLELPEDTLWAPTQTLGAVDLADEGPPSPEPTELQPFEMRQELGRGGMGVVHVAWQTRLGREVAVKRALSAEAERQLQREAWLTGRLQHPNIVPVHDLVREDDEGAFLVMRRIQGTAWSALLTGEAQLPEHAQHDPVAWHLGVLAQVCQAVAHAHARGVLHRDLKPDNVMVGAFGEVYVVDWGLAVRLDRLPDGRLLDLTAQRGLCGTPACMPPEMFARDEGTVGEAADVYLLGAMLWQVTVGRPLRVGTDLATLRDEARRPVRVPETLPAPLRALLRRALAVLPDARPDARTFHAELVRFAAHRDVESRVADARPRVDAVAAAVGADGDPPRADYGAARALLGQVLARLPDHEEARQLWRQLAGAMAEAELQRGNPGAARLVLADAPELLTAYAPRLAEAEEALARADARLAALEADQSRATHAGPRVALATALALSWLALPLVLGSLGVPRGIPWSLTHAALTGGMVLAAGVVLRRAVAGSQLNRALFVLLGMSAFGGVCLSAAAWQLELGAAGLTTVRALNDSFLVLLGALLFDARLLPGGVALLLAAAGTALAPAWASYLLFPATVLLLVNIVLVWGVPLLRRRGD